MEEEEEEKEIDKVGHPNDSEDPKQSSNRRYKDNEDDLPPPKGIFEVAQSVTSITSDAQ
jgi:hypothetical protein